MKIELTIATGKQFENIHLSTEIEDGNFIEATAFAEMAEDTFHNCFIKDEVSEKAEVADTGKDEILNL